MQNVRARGGLGSDSWEVFEMMELYDLYALLFSEHRQQDVFEYCKLSLSQLLSLYEYELQNEESLVSSSFGIF